MAILRLQFLLSPGPRSPRAGGVAPCSLNCWTTLLNVRLRNSLHPERTQCSSCDLMCPIVRWRTDLNLHTAFHTYSQRDVPLKPLLHLGCSCLRDSFHNSTFPPNNNRFQMFSGNDHVTFDAKRSGCTWQCFPTGNLVAKSIRNLLSATISTHWQHSRQMDGSDKPATP